MFGQHRLRFSAVTAHVKVYIPAQPLQHDSGDSAPRCGRALRWWLELTGLTRAPWCLRQPKLLTEAFGTRVTRHIAATLERLCPAGFVKEAVVGNVRYVYLAERACNLPVLLGYSIKEVACGDAALRLIRRAAGAASGVT